VADPARARELLGWATQLGLDAMCADSWRWQQGNPKGFDS
jgi:UDP-glucose 4-epimerase